MKLGLLGKGVMSLFFFVCFFFSLRLLLAFSRMGSDYGRNFLHAW